MNRYITVTTVKTQAYIPENSYTRHTTMLSCPKDTGKTNIPILSSIANRNIGSINSRQF